MIKLNSKHDKIELDAGFLLCNRSSEKRGTLVSKGCLFKVDNDIFNNNPQYIESNCSMYDWNVIFSLGVYAKLIWCVPDLNKWRMQIGKRKISMDRKTKEASDLLKCLETS